MDSDKYLEGKSMQRPPHFESGYFIYWKNRFETYVKAKDLDHWHFIFNGDFLPVARNKETQVLEMVPFKQQDDDLKKKLAKNNEAKTVLYNALPKKEYKRIFMCKTTKDIYGFARFNTNITSLKALDKGFSSKNYVRKFLRALHPKWRAKVMAIEESKDLLSLALDELIGNLKVHEVVMKKDSETYRGKKKRVKSISLKSKKESSDDETLTYGSDDEEYAIAVRNFKKFFRRKDAVIQIISLAIVQKHLTTKIKMPSLEVLGAIAKITLKTKPIMKLVSWLNRQMSANSLREMLNDQKSPSCKIGPGFDDSKTSTSGTKNMSFVGLFAKKTTDGSTIKVHGSTLPGSVCLRTCLEPDEWIKDSGFSKHMTDNKSLFSTHNAYDGGIDYDETYAPVARLESIKILLAIACANDFKLYQKGAFLNGFINEEVYVAQPPGFIDFQKPNYVYKLKKAFYGLKQAPKAWYDRLKLFLIKHEYSMGMIDNTLFTKKSKSHLIIVQIYFDDIIFGSTSQNLCDDFAKIMHEEFEMSMMRELNFVLGLQIKQIEDGIFFNQSKYIKEMLKKFGLEDSKPTKTPMSTEIKLTKDDEADSVDSSK
nr:copia protein [Tanacetum cinerariifolium]